MRGTDGGGWTGGRVDGWTGGGGCGGGDGGDGRVSQTVRRDGWAAVATKDKRTERSGACPRSALVADSDLATNGAVGGAVGGAGVERWVVRGGFRQSIFDDRGSGARTGVKRGQVKGTACSRSPACRSANLSLRLQMLSCGIGSFWQCVRNTGANVANWSHRRYLMT